MSGTEPLDAAAPVLEALGDPTRRRVLTGVADLGPVTATELARGLPVTRQAVAKHLGALEHAGLVRAERAGRETRYEAVPDALVQAGGALARAGQAWDQRLDRLRTHAARRRGGG